MGKNIQKNINIPSMVRQSEVVLVIVAHTDDETLGVWRNHSSSRGKW